MKSKNIYTVTSVTENGKTSRCWGFYLKYSSAAEAVKKNFGGLDDCMYDYVIIEQYEEGILGSAVAKQWFKYKKVPNNVEWVEINPPEWSEGIINWGIG